LKTELHKWGPLPHQCYNSVAISADGSRVVAGTFFMNKAAVPSQPKTVGIFAWDAVANQQLLSPPQGNQFQAVAPATNPPNVKWTRGGIVSVTISDDGKWAAAGGLISSTQGIVRAFNVDTGAMTLDHRPPAMVNSVVISPDGNYLIAGADVLYVFKRTSPTTWSAPITLALPGMPGQANRPVERVAVSADGAWIAAAVDKGWVALVHNPIGTPNPLQLVGALNLPKYFQAVAVANNGSGFAAACADGKVYYFGIPATVPIVPAALVKAWSWPLPNCRTCRWVDVSADGSRLVVIGSELNSAGNLSGRGNVFMLTNSANAGNPVWNSAPVVYTAHGPNSVSMDASYGSVAVADGSPPRNGATPKGGFSVFNGNDGTFRWRYSTTQPCYTMAVSADGLRAVGGSDDGHVYYFTLP